MSKDNRVPIEKGAILGMGYVIVDPKGEPHKLGNKTMVPVMYPDRDDPVGAIAESKWRIVAVEVIATGEVFDPPPYNRRGVPIIPSGETNEPVDRASGEVEQVREVPSPSSPEEDRTPPGHHPV